MPYIEQELLRNATTNLGAARTFFCLPGRSKNFLEVLLKQCAGGDRHIQVVQQKTVDRGGRERRALSATLSPDCESLCALCIYSGSAIAQGWRFGYLEEKLEREALAGHVMCRW